MDNLRVIYSNNGVLSDFSKELNKYQSGNQVISDFVASEDKIFIGSRHPFNHLFIKFITPNANNVTASIKYWDGEEFHSVVHIDDETNGFKNNGFITFFPDKDESWDRESTNHSGEQVTGLTSVKIYDLYWLELTFDSDFSANVDLSWFGQKFCDDDDLGGEYPDLNRSVMRDAFLKDGQVSGDKTDWEEQIVIASKMIIKDLKAKNLIYHSGQVLEREVFKLTCVSKLAEIIYNSLGDDYIDNRTSSRQEYISRLDNSVNQLDKNKNALVDVVEEAARSGFMSR